VPFICVNAQTVVIIVLTRSVPQLGSGHANHEISLSSVTNFDFETVSIDELFVGEYGLDLPFPSVL
jgi:hypothetical protein